jgi:starvation-inducible DNA-binding protein
LGILLSQTSHFQQWAAVAERVHKLGSTTLRSIGHISRLQRVLDNDVDFVNPLDMLAELRDDSKQLAVSLRELHGPCDDVGDVATSSLLETWIDEAERRTLVPSRQPCCAAINVKP